MGLISEKYCTNVLFIKKKRLSLFSFIILIYAQLPVSAQRRNFSAREQVIHDASMAQARRAITFTNKALRIGDRIPDFTLEKIFNYPHGRAKLSDFKGKSVLLYFWARNCGTCIGSFPKMERLRRKYADKVQILAVCTYNTLEELNIHEPGFPKYSTSEGIRNTTLPLVFNSQEMVNFFPHLYEPYLIWIDSNGLVQAMIDSWNIDDVMIDRLLAAQYNAYPLAVSFRKVAEQTTFASYDHAYPMITEGHGRLTDKIIYLKRSEHVSSNYVALAKLGCTYGNTGREIRDSATNQVIGERYLCLTLIELFRYAYPGSLQFVAVESFSPEKYYLPSHSEIDNWMKVHTYSFEVFAPTIKLRRNLLSEALKDYFKEISVKVETRKVKCLILRRISSKDKLKTHYPKADMRRECSRHLYSLQNCYFGYFIETLQFDNTLIHRNMALPILDETGFKSNHCIDLKLTEIGDLSGLKNQLRQYGLSLHEEKREIELLVLREIDK